MAERVYDWPMERRTSHQGYPWDAWTEGVWRLRRGEDFDVTASDFRKAAHGAARAMGVKVKTRVEDEGTVMLEFLRG